MTTECAFAPDPVNEEWCATCRRPRADHAPQPTRGEAPPIHWLGDATQDADVWELTRRRERFTIFGGPTTLYFAMDDGTHIIVPSGWWIYDWHTAHPRVSSEPPPPAPSSPSGADDVEALVDDYAALVREANDPEIEGGVPAAAARALAARTALLAAIRDREQRARREGHEEAADIVVRWRAFRGACDAAGLDMDCIEDEIRALSEREEG